MLRRKNPSLPLLLRQKRAEVSQEMKLLVESNLCWALSAVVFGMIGQSEVRLVSSFTRAIAWKGCLPRWPGIVSESLGSILQRGVVVVQTVFAEVRLQHFSRGEQLQLWRPLTSR